MAGTSVADHSPYRTHQYGPSRVLGSSTARRHRLENSTEGSTPGQERLLTAGHKSGDQSKSGFPGGMLGHLRISEEVRVSESDPRCSGSTWLGCYCRGGAERRMRSESGVLFPGHEWQDCAASRNAMSLTGPTIQ